MAIYCVVTRQLQLIDCVDLHHPQSCPVDPPVTTTNQEVASSSLAERTNRLNDLRLGAGRWAVRFCNGIATGADGLDDLEGPTTSRALELLTLLLDQIGDDGADTRTFETKDPAFAAFHTTTWLLLEQDTLLESASCSRHRRTG
jgi:hypothetical protein